MSLKPGRLQISGYSLDVNMLDVLFFIFFFIFF